MRRALALLPLLCVAAAACSSSAKTAAPATTLPPPTSTSGATTAPPTTIATTAKKSAYIVSVDPAAHTVTLDPMEFLTGSAANAAYRHDNPGAQESTPPNDYYIVNATKDHVVMPLAPDVIVLLYRTATTVLTNPQQITVPALAHLGELTIRPFWITTERGKISQIEEQYVP